MMPPAQALTQRSPPRSDFGRSEKATGLALHHVRGDRIRRWQCSAPGRLLVGSYRSDLENKLPWVLTCTR